MLNRLNVAAAILIFGLPPLATPADDDGKTADKTQAAGGDKKPSAKKMSRPPPLSH